MASSKSELSRQVQQLVLSGKYAQALQLLDEAIERYPDDDKIKKVHSYVLAKSKQVPYDTNPTTSIPSSQTQEALPLDKTFANDDEDVFDQPERGKDVFGYSSAADEKSIVDKVRPGRQVNTSDSVQRAVRRDREQATRGGETAQMGSARAQKNFGDEYFSTADKVSSRSRELAAQGTDLAKKGMARAQEMFEEQRRTLEQSSTPGEDEFADKRGGIGLFAQSLNSFGAYQGGWADTFVNEGQVAEQFHELFWQKLLDQHGLAKRVLHSGGQVRSARRVERMEFARDGIVTALIMINRYGNDLYLSWRSFMRLPFIRWKVILFAVIPGVSLITGITAAVVLPVWIGLSVLSWLRGGDFLLWLKGSVSEFDYDDLAALSITIGEVILETAQQLHIDVSALRPQPGGMDNRKVQHI